MTTQNKAFNTTGIREQSPLGENPKHDAIINVRNPNKLRRFIASASLGLVMLTGCNVDSPSTGTTPEGTQVTAPSRNLEGTPDKKIVVMGDQECQDDTQAALELLSNASHDTYQTVLKYVDIIECTPQGSGMAAYEEKPRFIVGDSTRESGTIWYASTIVHDAIHSKLYQDFKTSNPGQPIPAEAWSGEEAEATCLAAQAQALTDMGAPADTIDYVVNSTETEYWKVDSKDRDW